MSVLLHDDSLSAIEPVAAPGASGETLVNSVAEAMRDRILSGQWRSGQTLAAEGDLAAAFGVSRNVAREGLRTLHGAGLVELAQGRRARVCPPSPEAAAVTLQGLLRGQTASLHHLLDVRAPLESEAAARAARRADPVALAAIEGEVERLETAALPAERVEADIAFHLRLAEASGNPILPLLLSTLVELMRQLLSATLDSDGAQRAAAGHRTIMASLHAGDAEGARRQMLNHLDIARQDLAAAGCLLQRNHDDA